MGGQAWSRICLVFQRIGACMPQVLGLKAMIMDNLKVQVIRPDHGRVRMLPKLCSHRRRDDSSALGSRSYLEI